MEKSSFVFQIFGFQIDQPIEWAVLGMVILGIFAVIFQVSGAVTFWDDHKIRKSEVSLKAIWVEYLAVLKKWKILVILALVVFLYSEIVGFITSAYAAAYYSAYFQDTTPLMMKNYLDFSLIVEVLSIISNLSNFGDVSRNDIWWIVFPIWLYIASRTELKKPENKTAKIVLTSFFLLLTIKIVFWDLMMIKIYTFSAENDTASNFAIYYLEAIGFIDFVLATSFKAGFLFFLIIVFSEKSFDNPNRSLVVIKSGWFHVLLAMLPFVLLAPISNVYRPITVGTENSVLMMDGAMLLRHPERILYLFMPFLIVSVSEFKLRRGYKIFLALLRKYPQIVLGLPLVAAVFWLPIRVLLIFYSFSRWSGNIYFIALGNGLLAPLSALAATFYCGFCWCLFVNVFHKYLMPIAIED